MSNIDNILVVSDILQATVLMFLVCLIFSVAMVAWNLSLVERPECNQTNPQTLILPPGIQAEIECRVSAQSAPSYWVWTLTSLNTSIKEGVKQL